MKLTDSDLDVTESGSTRRGEKRLEEVSVVIGNDVLSLHCI